MGFRKKNLTTKNGDLSKDHRRGMNIVREFHQYIQMYKLHTEYLI